HNWFQFISLLLLLPLLCSCIEPAQTGKKPSGLISEICPNTHNPILCFQVLSSDHNTNLSAIGHASVEAAQESAILGYDAIQVSIKQENNSLLIDRYRSCLGNYARAGGDIAILRQLLNCSSYKRLPSKAYAALAEAEICDKILRSPE
ncbi:hypothetical protein Pfo_008341, partial [Paulownia fortunei]